MEVLWESFGDGEDKVENNERNLESHSLGTSQLHYSFVPTLVLRVLNESPQKIQTFSTQEHARLQITGSLHSLQMS